MNVYDKMEQALQFNNLIDCGHSLIEFADIALEKNNKKTIIKHFYEKLYQNTLIHYTFDRSDKILYYICENKEAIGMYINFSVGNEQSPVKLLKK